MILAYFLFKKHRPSVNGLQTNILGANTGDPFTAGFHLSNGIEQSTFPVLIKMFFPIIHHL